MPNHNNIPPEAWAYNAQRWQQLNGLVITHTEGALTALLTVNGGALAGTLAFIGAVPNFRNSCLAMIGLTLFAIGLVLAGATRAYTLETMKSLQKNWVSDFQSYIAEQLTWSQLLGNDNARVKHQEWRGPLLGYSSFGAFLLGLVFAGIAIFQLQP